MLGGGHIPKRDLFYSEQASPCVRMEKRAAHRLYPRAGLRSPPRPVMLSPSRSGKKTSNTTPSLMHRSPTKFGDERMNQAQHGSLARYSLEESVLVAEGEESSVNCEFRPLSILNRSQQSSSPCTCVLSTSSSRSRHGPFNGFSSVRRSLRVFLRREHIAGEGCPQAGRVLSSHPSGS